VRIADREIGPGHQPYIIAEISGEHRHEMDRMFRLIDAAVDASADSVKFQCFSPLVLAVSRGGPGKVLTSGPWAGMCLRDIYEATYTPRGMIIEAAAYCKHLGMTWFASAFSEDDIDFLETLDCPATKISSFELTNLPLIRKAASTGKPLILSTGMADWDDIDDAVNAAFPCALLHCVSAYPCSPDQANLERIDELRHCNAKVIGFSDHTLGPECSIAAVALGASIIEKHITLDRNDGGLDASFSMEPHEFKSMVKAIRNVHLALQPPKGDGEAIYRGLRSRA
jgi:sialic acid synthase SpsE